MASDSPQTLFTVPVESTDGSITVTIPRPSTHSTVYLLTFYSPPDNRLTTSFIKSFLLALSILRTNYPHGVLITTSSSPKFYSNGLDLNHVRANEGWWKNILWPYMKSLLSYPMPTIALLNGHAFAGGFITAMCHDYRVMNPKKGFACMNELEFGAPLIPPLTSIFRNKLSAKTYRSIILEAKRYPGEEALKEDIVDALGGLDEVFELVKERKLDTKTKSGAYSVLRREMWRETYGFVSGDKECDDAEGWMKRVVEEDEKDERAAKEATELWAKQMGKQSKL